ncbi:hypothetical protein [Mucilaginibacter sp.]|uniref:hypothetical protein n=1 Tax=Mucilaginibacter sp. TaxID=1882438 RepID=UPI0035BBC01F
MKIKINGLLVLILAVVLAGSCKKDDPTTSLEINVINGATNAASPGATIKLYAGANAVSDNVPTYTNTTDVSGRVKFNVKYQNQYYIIVENGSAKNFYSGLVPVAIFKTQADISASPAQNPIAVIGGIKFQDINGDGVVNAQDNIVAPLITIKAQTNNTISVTIY